MALITSSSCGGHSPSLIGFADSVFGEGRFCPVGVLLMRISLPALDAQGQIEFLSLAEEDNFPVVLVRATCTMGAAEVGSTCRENRSLMLMPRTKGSGERRAVSALNAPYRVFGAFSFEEFVKLILGVVVFHGAQCGQSEDAECRLLGSSFSQIFCHATFVQIGERFGRVEADFGIVGLQTFLEDFYAVLADCFQLQCSTG